MRLENTQAGNAGLKTSRGRRWLLLRNHRRNVLGIGSILLARSIKALFWSAVINGFRWLYPLCSLMWVGRSGGTMPLHGCSPTLTLGWATTGIMAAAAIAMLLF